MASPSRQKKRAPSGLLACALQRTALVLAAIAIWCFGKTVVAARHIAPPIKDQSARKAIKARLFGDLGPTAQGTLEMTDAAR